MVNLIRHYVAALVIFSMMFTLYGGVYFEMKDHYGFNETYTGINGTESLSERIEGMGIMTSLDTATKGIFSIVNPSGITDVIGGLMATAFGTLGLFFGLFTMPIQIIGVITGFYYVPPIVSIGIGLIVLIYIGFIYLSSRARNEI